MQILFTDRALPIDCKAHGSDFVYTCICDMHNDKREEYLPKNQADGVNRLLQRFDGSEVFIRIK